MSDKLEPLAVVALLIDLPDHHLARGQVGTIVARLAPDVFEVDFSDDQGRAYAFFPLRDSQLTRLHYQPVQAA